MKNKIEPRTNGGNHRKNVVISLLIGSLAWAVAMLLFAPQSKKQTVRESSAGKSVA